MKNLSDCDGDATSFWVFRCHSGIRHVKTPLHDIASNSFRSPFVGRPAQGRIGLDFGRSSVVTTFSHAKSTLACQTRHDTLVRGGFSIVVAKQRVILACRSGHRLLDTIDPASERTSTAGCISDRRGWRNNWQDGRKAQIHCWTNKDQCTAAAKARKDSYIPNLWPC